MTLTHILLLLASFQFVSERQVVYVRNYPPVSPDGKSYLLADRSGIVMRSVDAAGEKRISDIASAKWVGWSADQKSVYYLQVGSKPWINDLWRVGISGGKPELLVRDAGGVSIPKPTPSPDGKSIAIFRQQSIIVTNADGKNERKVCDCGEFSFFDAHWSPDSSQLLFVRMPNPYVTGSTNVALVTVATGAVTELGAIPDVASSMVWPSWGSGFFYCATGFRRDGRGGGQIWHFSLPERKRTQLTVDASGYSWIHGLGPDEMSLLAEHWAPGLSEWDAFLKLFGVRPEPTPPRTVVLRFHQ